jgi:hypothetical protein
MLVTQASLSAQGEVLDSTLFNKIYTQDNPKITVTTDFMVILGKGNEEVPGTFELEGDDKIWDIQLEARGKHRRRTCLFPPLLLNFKKSHLREEGYEDYDKIKLVTHCSDSEYGLESVFKEFLAYQVYNQITDQSFRAKLVQVVYVDNSDHYETIESWGIILEPNNEMAARVGGELLDKYNLPADSLVGETYVRMAMFQFMIGNHDWSVEMYKNIKCLYVAELGKYMIIPYDFDFTGMVDPDYHNMNRDINQEHPKDRIYLGKHFDELIPEVVTDLLAKKKEIVAFCKSFEPVPNPISTNVNRYINSYFKKIKKDASKITYSYRIPFDVL